MISKNIYGYISLILVFVTYIPYIHSILKQETKPHLFSWINWTLLTGLAAAGQYSAEAGPGAWSTALNTVFCFATIFLCISHGDRSITRGDWVALIVGLAALPLWYITNSPLAAVSLSTVVNVLGYYSTFRKSYDKPKQEMIFSYITCNVEGALSIFAMQDLSLTTIMYPIAMVVVNSALIAMLIWRRHCQNVSSVAIPWNVA